MRQSGPEPRHGLSYVQMKVMNVVPLSLGSGTVIWGARCGWVCGCRGREREREKETEREIETTGYEPLPEAHRMVAGEGEAVRQRWGGGAFDIHVVPTNSSTDPLLLLIYRIS